MTKDNNQTHSDTPLGVRVAGALAGLASTHYLPTTQLKYVFALAGVAGATAIPYYLHKGLQNIHLGLGFEVVEKSLAFSPYEWCQENKNLCVGGAIGYAFASAGIGYYIGGKALYVVTPILGAYAAEHVYHATEPLHPYINTAYESTINFVVEAKNYLQNCTATSQISQIDAWVLNAYANISDNAIHD